MAKKQRITMVGSVLTCEYPTIGKTLTVDVSKYAAAISLCARDHGYKQKFGDAASGGTPMEKYLEVQKIHESLLAGEWERTATVDLTPIICEAVSRIKKIPLAKVEKAAEGHEDQVKLWHSNAKVKAEILKIRAERAAKVAAESDDELTIDLK